MKKWIEWPEDCSCCGGQAFVLTDHEGRDECWVCDGDLVRCDSCYCLGHIVVDSYEENNVCCGVEWPNDACALWYRESRIEQGWRNSGDWVKQEYEGGVAWIRPAL